MDQSFSFPPVNPPSRLQEVVDISSVQPATDHMEASEWKALHRSHLLARSTWAAILFVPSALVALVTAWLLRKRKA